MRRIKEKPWETQTKEVFVGSEKDRVAPVNVLEGDLRKVEENQLRDFSLMLQLQLPSQKILIFRAPLILLVFRRLGKSIFSHQVLLHDSKFSQKRKLFSLYQMYS